MYACCTHAGARLCPAVLTRLAQADSFSWDNIAPPRANAAIDTNEWPEFERRKAMFEGNDGARRRPQRAAVWWPAWRGCACARANSLTCSLCPCTCRVRAVCPHAAALAKIPKPPAQKCRWGPCAGGPDDYAHLSLAIVEPRQHEWMRAVLWNACHIWGGSGAVCP